MPNYVLRHSVTLADVWMARGLEVTAYLDANPGSTFGQIATGIGINSNDLQDILRRLELSGALYRGHDIHGTEFLWTTWTMAQETINLLAPIRQWVIDHDNVTIDQLATQFSCHQAVAFKVACILQVERDIALDQVV